jgi:hypothetical protein
METRTDAWYESFSINLIDIYLFLDIFQFDEENERKYNQIQKIILGETGDHENKSDSYSTDSDEENDEVDTEEGK